ncbi:glycoside hydrolase family 2 protein [Niabella insulamsoli]|uniref:glycoside hydrolase family 2 protein n=1 Tax=Niabella insulamsoli TaxID=3144874 RepID=UPI0031FC86D0
MYKILTFVLALISLNLFAQNYKPAPARLTTQWGEAVTPENAWQQYPRPQMKRSDWKNLNGLWDYSIQQKGAVKPAGFEGKILVPFCVESSLSGVGKPLLPEQELWYSKRFTVPQNWEKKEIILHFDAVDWETRVWLNGKLVGSHQGGSDPFQFNITPHLNKGEQELVVAVWDPTDKEMQARGKQTLDPKGIWYTAVSGIWQSVWLEPVSKGHIIDVYPVPDIDKSVVAFGLQSASLTGSHQLNIVVKNGGAIIKDTTFSFHNNFVLPLENAKLWTPETPELYHTTLTVKKRGQVVDQLETYFAMRKTSLIKDDNGYMRLALNNKPVFHLGTLDQGWWPDGLLTPPSEEAMMYDIIKLKEMGFNTIRKHIKVEPSRYYYMADSIGVLLWQDMPSGFLWPNHPSHVGHDDKEDWVRPQASAVQFEKEWKAIMDHLRFFPSIVMWVPFNEGWGQYDTKRITAWTRKYDPTRLVNSPSGWTDRGVGDVLDVHQYPGPGMGVVELNPGRSMVLGEFGGLGLVVKDHIWNPNKRNWGYKTYTEDAVLIREYTELMHNLSLMVKRGLSAAIYTQTTDVEGEVNGLITYDRKVIKIPETLLQKLHQPVYDPADGRVLFINQLKETDRPNIFHSLQEPPADWLTQPVQFQKSKQKIALKKEGNVYAYQDVDFGKEMPEGLGLKLYASGDVNIYINGVKVWSEDQVRIKRHYDDINLSSFLHLLKPWNNRVAVEAKSATQDVDFDFALYQWNK